MPRFHVGTAVLATELSDEGGQAVVQLHGLSSSRARDRVLDLDLGRGLSGTRLLRYDARGHGRSTGRAVPEDYRWESLAEDLLRLLDHYFPGEQVHGVGPSMGAGTLLHAAVREPERFNGLTLMLPSTAWQTRVSKSEEYRKIAALVEERGSGALFGLEPVAKPPATVGTPETLPEISEQLMPSVYRGAALSDLPSPAQISALRIPTSVLAWVEDPAHPVSTALSLVELLHGASLRVATTPEEVATWPSLLHEQIEDPVYG